jgi:hypothetical protein
VRVLVVSGLLLGGCAVVYDAQYNDRAGELEELRREIFPAESNVQLLASGGERLFWVDRVRPADQNVMHSVVPPSFTAIDYEWSRDDSDSDLPEYHFGSQLVVHCPFGSARAFSPTARDTQVGRTGFSNLNCAVDGTTVYFLVGNRIDRWVPSGEPPNPEPELPTEIDFETSEIAGTVDGFGVIDRLAIVTETGGDIYTVDLDTKEITWLENDAQVAGRVFFDDRRVIFETVNADGPRIIDYATRNELSFTQAIADGGYHLNFKHGDIQEPAQPAEFVLHDDHVIYRGRRGIFAYGLATGKVIDLLLDRGDVSDPEIRYRRPTVTSGGFMYVESESGFGQAGPVYEVDLNGRLPGTPGASARQRPGSRARLLGRSRTPSHR